MNPDSRRAVVRSFYADIRNRRDKSKIPALLHTDFTFRGSLGRTLTGHDGFASYADFGHAVLGDVHGLLQLLEQQARG